MAETLVLCFVVNCSTLHSIRTLRIYAAIVQTILLVFGQLLVSEWSLSAHWVSVSGLSLRTLRGQW